MKGPIAAAVALLAASVPAFAQETPITPAPGAPAPTFPPPPATAPLPAPTPALPPPAPAPTLPPAPGAAPAYVYPPGYTYPPGYPYPAYGYPPGYSYPPPAYPQYPQGYAPYPAYPQTTAPTVLAPPPEFGANGPCGRWRVGLALLIAPTGTLSYTLSYRGEALLAYSGATAITPGVRPFFQVDIVRIKRVQLHLGLAAQILPTIKWASSSSTSNNHVFDGTGSEVDILPELAGSVSVLSGAGGVTLRLMLFGAPGYSFLSASDLASKVYADPGTTKGFVVQAGFGGILGFGKHFFLDGRLAQQWGFQSSQVKSSTTDQIAQADVHTNLFSLQVGMGYWF